jgi:hypothetical protein
MRDMDERSLEKVQKKKSEFSSQKGGKPFVLKNLASEGLLLLTCDSFASANAKTVFLGVGVGIGVEH